MYLKQQFLCFEILTFFPEICARVLTFILFMKLNLFMASCLHVFNFKYCQNKNCFSENINTSYKEQGCAALHTHTNDMSISPDVKLFLPFLCLKERNKMPVCSPSVV